MIQATDVHAGAQIAVGVALAAGGIALGGRGALVPGLAALVVTPLVIPVPFLAFHLLSSEPWKAVVMAAVVLPLATGLVAPYLARRPHGLFVRVVIGMAGLGMLAAGVWLRAHGS